MGRERRGLPCKRWEARACLGSPVLGGWQGVKAYLPCADSGAVGCLPVHAANTLAEVEGGSPAAVVFCPGLCWIWSLLIALSVIKIPACVIHEKGPVGVRRVCFLLLARLAAKRSDLRGMWLMAWAAVADPRSHGWGLLLHGRMIVSIHDRSVPKPHGNICPCTVYMQHLDVHTCGLEFLMNRIPLIIPKPPWI